MKDLVEEHPILKNLPLEVRKKLVVDPGEWTLIPGNKRKRRLMKRGGFVVHLYSGEADGFTLMRAFQQVGGDESQLVEIDVKRD